MRHFKPRPRRRPPRWTPTEPIKGLILSRAEGEAIIIGEDIRITVLEVCGRKCKLCIDAPSQVPVDRVEVRKLKEQNKQQP